MKRGVWVAALALGLGGGVAGAFGQAAVWRTVTRPAAPAAARTSTAARPSAVLGKPVPITRGASPEPRPFPEAYRGNPLPMRVAQSGVELIATVPPPGAIIAASASAQAAHPPALVQAPEPTQDAGLIGDLFAADRILPASLTKLPPPAPPPAPSAVPEPRKSASWVETFSPFPEAPKPLAHGEVFFTEDLPPTKWYARGEYLLWWIKNDSAPPLVTTTTLSGPLLDRNNPTVGALGQPETVTLFGGDLERDPFSGGRFTFGYYCDDCAEKAVEFSGFFLGQRSATFVSDSFTTAVLTRPFTVANAPGGQSVERISFPGEACGKVTVKAASSLWGLEPNLLCKVCCGCDYRFDVLAGVRYLNLSENLTVEENIIFDSGLTDVFDERGVSLAGASNFVKDRFSARNQFYGGQVGVEGRWQRDRLTLDGRAKVGLGVTNQQLSVEGFQVVRTVPDNATTGYVGGLLALRNNIGDRERDVFSVVPEVSVMLGYYVTDRLRATVEYNFLYWSHVVRPGEQIDPVLNVNQIPNFGKRPDNPDRPAPLFQSTDFWAHGITAGFEYRY